MSPAADRYRVWDAAYVLGVLSEDDRREFEEHLSGCADCRSAVAELSAMPGLLAHVPRAETPAREPVQEVRSEASVWRAPATGGRPGRWAWLALAVTVALLVGGLGGFLAGSRLDPAAAPAAAASPFRVAFVPVAPSSMTAVADVVPVPGGTEVRVECQYGTANTNWTGGAAATYSIWIIDRAGAQTEAKIWTARPQRVMRPVAPSPLTPQDIAAVEIRITGTGRTLLRASLI